MARIGNGMDKTSRVPAFMVVFGITVGSILFTLAAVIGFAPLLGVTITPPVLAFVIVLPALAAPAITVPLLAANQRLNRVRSALYRQARTDDLTGLPNRRAFFENALVAFSSHDPAAPAIAVLMIDIDRFKQVNDTYGHDAGDVLLCAVAVAIANTVAAADAKRATVARVGGEEFASLVEGLVPTAVGRLAERICENVRAVAVVHGDETLKATVSVGVALARAGANIDVALGTADDAVYAAKRAGRDRWSYADGHSAAPPRTRKAAARGG